MDLPLSELCEDINPPGRSSERYEWWKVGTYAHLHAAHAPSVLATIAVEGVQSRDGKTVQARRICSLGAQRWQGTWAEAVRIMGRTRTL